MDIKEIAPKLTQKLAIAINDDEALAQPSDTSALDAYVAEKVKEAKP